LSSRASQIDRRSLWPVILSAGISGYDPLLAGIPVRDMRGMKEKPAVVCAAAGNRLCRFARVFV
jgi:hypothetical protein